MSTTGKVIVAIVGLIAAYWALGFIFGALVSVLHLAFWVAVIGAIGYGVYRISTANALGTGERKRIIDLPRIPRLPK